MREVKTRSTHKDYSLLEELYKTPEKDVETFLEVLNEEIDTGESPIDGSMVRRLATGKPDVVKAPRKLTPCLSGFVRIFHGWHNSDYVWHIEHAAIRRPWKVSVNRVIYIIAKIMHDNLPDVEAKIWPPQNDWELKTVTFKAIGLADEWSFDVAAIDTINRRLLESLNQVV